MIRYLTKFSLQNLLKFDKETRDNISAIPSPVGSVEWDNVENKPTTVEGYGITDVYNKSEVDDIEDRVSDNEDDISELYNKVDTIDGDVDTLSSTVGTLSTKVYNAESDIDTLETTTSSLVTAIDGLGGRVSDNEDDIKDIKANLHHITIGTFRVTVTNGRTDITRNTTLVSGTLPTSFSNALYNVMQCSNSNNAKINIKTDLNNSIIIHSDVAQDVVVRWFEFT